MAQTFYVAKNGQEYLTEDDANGYGGGLVGVRDKLDDVVKKVVITPAELPATEVDEMGQVSTPVISPVMPTPVPSFSTDDIETWTDEQLKAYAKQLGIRVCSSGRETLINKIKTTAGN